MLHGLSALPSSPQGTLQKVSPGSLCFPRDSVPTSSWTCLIPPQPTLQGSIYTFGFLVPLLFRQHSSKATLVV